MAKLGKTFMSLFLDKRAREKLAATKSVAGGAKNARSETTSQASAPQISQSQVSQPEPPRSQPHLGQEEINARLDEAVEARAHNATTADRQALIRDALSIRADKARMLNDLPEEQRRKLQAMAMMAMMKKPQR